MSSLISGYHRPSRQTRFIRRKNQLSEKIKEKSRLFKQKISKPDLGIIGAFHGTNVGDNTLGLSIFELAKENYPKASFQNFYGLQNWEKAEKVICAGGATGVKTNLINLTRIYGSCPENIALVGMDFSADFSSSPDDVLIFLSKVKSISFRSYRQTKAAIKILKRNDIEFKFDNAFSWSNLKKDENIDIAKKTKIFGFNTLNFFMTWKRGKGFFPGSPLSHWYKQQGSPLSDVIDQLGPQYINYVNKVLDVYLERGWEIIHIPFTPEDDLFAKTFFGQKKICFSPFNSNPKVVSRQISHCNLFFSTRYHSLVFALACQVPCIAFRYSAKCTDLLSDLGESLRYSIDRMDLIDSFSDALETALYPEPFLIEETRISDIRLETRNHINSIVESI